MYVFDFVETIFARLIFNKRSKEVIVSTFGSFRLFNKCFWTFSNSLAHHLSEAQRVFLKVTFIK